jgi:hypothetical protein
MKTISVPTWNRLEYVKQVIDGLCSNDELLLSDYRIYFSCEPYDDVVEYLYSVPMPCLKYIHINDVPKGCIENTYNSMKLAFDAGSEWGIYLEEDTVPGSDFLELAEFYRTNEELKSKSDLMNYTFYTLEQGSNNTALHYKQHFTGWGFACNKEQWDKHFKNVWNQGWDTVELQYMLSKGLCTVYPEVSRVKNIGESGLDYNPALYQAHGLGNVAVNQERGLQFHVS